MLESIADLTRVRPHVRNYVKRTPSDYQAYQEGYYTGVIYSLRVAMEAERRFRAGARWRRAAARARRSA